MKTKGWAVRVAGAGTLALMLAAPMVAQTRDSNGRRNEMDRGGRAQSSQRSYRENDRVTLQGRVSSLSRERDGYRVRLDRNNQSFWVPQSYLGNRARNFNVGVSISLGGVFRGGEVYVDAVNWPNDGGYNDPYGYGSQYDRGYVRGTIDRVDYRRGVAWLRDDASGRLIEADLRNAGRYSRIDGRDLRRGDRVELSGDWVRGNVFLVNQIDAVRTSRY